MWWKNIFRILIWGLCILLKNDLGCFLFCQLGYCHIYYYVIFGFRHFMHAVPLNTTIDIVLSWDFFKVRKPLIIILKWFIDMKILCKYFEVIHNFSNFFLHWPINWIKIFLIWNLLLNARCWLSEEQQILRYLFLLTRIFFFDTTSFANRHLN